MIITLQIMQAHCTIKEQRSEMNVGWNTCLSFPIFPASEKRDRKKYGAFGLLRIIDGCWVPTRIRSE